MSESSFAIGQRWISDTESDLGLGTILDVEHRQVTVVFLASGDTRIYAKETAPLTRVAFRAGDAIDSHEGWQLLVDSVAEEDGLLSYHGRRSDNGETTVIGEDALDNFLQFRSPTDRLFAGLIDGQRWFELRQQVFEHRQRLAHSPVRGLLGARVSLLPHQIHIAVESLKRHHPRVLLADEVGLGKTIEAGMILHASLITHKVSRVLIAVPAPLLHQWLVEMLRKFNLRFSIMDEERFAGLAASSPDGNPFLSEQLVLCAAESLFDDEAMGDAAIAAGWDMLIVDEAHHLQWHPDTPSPEYEYIEALSVNTPSVLLLTATPEQLGQAGHFARLRLLDHDRFSDLQHYLADESHFGEVAASANKLFNEQALDAAEIRQLESLLGESFDAAAKKTLGSSAALSMSELSGELVNALVDRHGTGRLMFRNTRHAITGFPERVLHTYELDDDSLEEKALWLMDFLTDHYPSKVLLICAERESVYELAEILRISGVSAAKFHEDMSIVERDRAAAWFSDPEEACQILLCSEIGSEGRNFQFLHHLVTFELPSAPDLLEQRIGRLDRIGQTETVQIHVPFASGSADHTLLRFYHEGLQAFEHTCTIGSAVLAKLGEELFIQLQRAESHDSTADADDADDSESKGADAADSDTTGLDSLISATQTLATQLSAELETGRDRLLELNSNRPERVQEHLDALNRADRDYQLQDFMDAVFDRFGVDVSEQRDHWIIKPSDHMQVEHFPHLGEGGLSVTFDRSVALAREELVFLTWDHPMVTAAMDLIMNEGYGQADCQVVAVAELPAGLAFIETAYILQCTAEASLNIERFLPLTLQRFAIGIDGKNYTQTLEGIDLGSLKQRYDRNALRKVVLKHRGSLETLVKHTAALSEQSMPELVEQARNGINERFRLDHERLTALARVNPSVKPAELQQLVDHRDALLDALHGTHARLISVRVMFNSGPAAGANRAGA